MREGIWAWLWWFTNTRNCVLKPIDRKEPPSTLEKRNSSVLGLGNANLIGASNMGVRKSSRRVSRKITGAKIRVVALGFKRKEQGLPWWSSG